MTLDTSYLLPIWAWLIVLWVVGIIPAAKVYDWWYFRENGWHDPGEAAFYGMCWLPFTLALVFVPLILVWRFVRSQVSDDAGRQS